jgi:hypothetical protein
VEITVDVRREDHELVSADARNGVSRSQSRHQLSGHLAQYGVARRVPLGVVDVLEPVEVDEQDGGATARVLRV